MNQRIFVLSVLLVLFSRAVSAEEQPFPAAIQQQLTTIEQQSNGRLGVALLNTATGIMQSYRGTERFPVCSTSKVIAAANILQLSAQQPTLLAKPISVDAKQIVSYSPITEQHVGRTMTIAAISAAALQYSDNTAMNLLLQQLGGPAAVTAFARSHGDADFRLDRTEPELNSAIPDDERDTSTPQAMAHSLYRFTLGDALAEPQRAQLVSWMKGNTTGNASIRAGVPQHWVVADKTGGGDYGTTNDIAVIWPEHGAPLVLTIYYTQPDKAAKWRKDVIASATAAVLQHQ
ncbi:class A beta-lactamase [Shewanella sp. A3A]|nr:class A beta-lactamase [Shewanella ferrihydritica]